MVLTMTLSPWVECRVWLPELQYGKDNLISKMREGVSGRGIRMGTALRELGDEVLCMGFCSAEGERIIAQVLADAGVERDFIKVPGALRMRIAIYDEKGATTRCIQQGTAIEGRAVEQMEVAYARNLSEMGEGDVVALGGHVPPGIGPEIYAELIGMAKDRKVRAVLAAQEENLEKGVLAGPYAALLCKEDLESLAGRALHSQQECCQAAREILEQSGGSYLCIEMQEKLLLVSPGQAFSAPISGERKGMRAGAAAGLAHAAQHGAGEALLRSAAAGRALLCKDAPVQRLHFERCAGEIAIEEIAW